MALIESGKSFKLENLLTIRKKMLQNDVNNEIMNIGKLLHEKNIKKNGPVITATYAVELQNGQPLMDVEIMLPINRKIDLPEEYKFKEEFFLQNAIYAKYIGNPSLLPGIYSEIKNYIGTNNLKQITPAYNVYINNESKTQSIDNMEIDVYVGIN
jgi:effector-binding domain-containing protein